MELLTVVTNQIGIAMDNARPYQRLQKKFTLSKKELKKTQQRLIQSERQMVIEALEKTGGNRSQTARILGLTRQGLLNKIVRYQICGSRDVFVIGCP